MTNRSLDAEEIGRLIVPKGEHHWSSSSDVRPKLYNAFKEGSDEVVIRKDTFSIKYNDGGQAYVQNTTGFVPCGWFDVAAFMRVYEQST